MQIFKNLNRGRILHNKVLHSLHKKNFSTKIEYDGFRVVETTVFLKYVIFHFYTPLIFLIMALL